MKAYAVIGSAYGDEGKGLFTDYLTHKNPASNVVRFNGGAQAGHTVTTPENLRHVFGHVGSGSFNAGSSTFLSEYFVSNTLVLNKELQALEKLNIKPHLIIQENSYLSTPFDMLLNQLLEQKRGNEKHGSCGLGFGETIQRCETIDFKTTISDIKTPNILNDKLIYMRHNYFMPRIKSLNLDTELKNFSFILEDLALEKFIENTQKILPLIEISKNSLPFDNVDKNGVPENQKTLIFEGAQGLLLDQNMGHFPYVTRSNTGLKNIIELLNQRNKSIYPEVNLEVIHASRCYTTRHGAGPLSRELSHKPYENIEDKTNIHNEYQGTIRFSYLDLDILKNSIEKDKASVKIPSDIKITFKLGLSCLDQTDHVCFYENRELNTLASQDFVNYIAQKFEVSVLASFGPTRTTIQ